MSAITLASGDLAYIDSFAGLIPCKVQSIASTNDCTVLVTANRGAYKKGDLYGLRPGRDVIARKTIALRCHGSFRIYRPTAIITDIAPEAAK